MNGSRLAAESRDCGARRDGSEIAESHGSPAGGVIHPLDDGWRLTTIGLRIGAAQRTEGVTVVLAIAGFGRSLLALSLVICWRRVNTTLRLPGWHHIDGGCNRRVHLSDPGLRGCNRYTQCYWVRLQLSGPC